MNNRYNHHEVEKKWQKKWNEDGLYKFDEKDTAEKKYVLVEFPYPSGILHAGHMYAFSVPDMYARFKKMQGYNVLFPFGYDSFGLPAENAAIKNNINPKEWTDKNIEVMTDQIKSLGTMIDFSRLIKTSSPDFYGWTQYIFTKFFESGLVYKGLTTVNWCPKDKTILANEQVTGGRCERCETEVLQKEMPQWMIRITNYADRLIDDLDTLDWPNEIKESQKNWIGRSRGSLLDFEIDDGVKRNYILLHGYNASPEHNFHQFLKSELEKRGHKVSVPNLPNPSNPNVYEQVEAVLAECSFDQETILLGHSLGTMVAMKVLEKIDKPIRRLILVSPFISRGFKDKYREFEETFDWKFDFEKIKNNAKSITILADQNDHTVPIEKVNEVKSKIGGRLVVTTATESHFKAKQEIEVLRASLPSVKVFTTRADTLFGVTYLALAPENELLNEIEFQNKNEVKEYQQIANSKSELERKQDNQKTGVCLDGVFAIHPITSEKIPIWTADYILNNYGTGAIMAVPAHDDRDYEFANKYGLPVKKVIDHSSQNIENTGLLLNSGEFNGLNSETAKIKITEKVNGKMTSTYRLRDWGISRQRYWGTPIPIVYDPAGNPHPVPKEHLPWLLPEDVDFIPDGTAPLAKSKELIERTEEIFGKGWRPEFDTMDTFVDSTWYFIRYLDTKNKNLFAEPDLINRWLPVDFYSGGAEHTTMHLLYSRFWYKAMYDLKMVNTNEPFVKRLNRGLILGTDGRKMSKRWGNVIDPLEQIDTFGADSLRAYLAFIAPFNEVATFPWDTNGLVGIRRFIERLVNLNEKILDFIKQKREPENTNLEIKKILHKTIDKITNDLDNLKSNTAVSALMIFSNELRKKIDLEDSCPITLNDYVLFLRLLAPFAPHIADEMYSSFGYDHSIHQSAWPVASLDLIYDDMATIPLQINGKVKITYHLPKNLKEDEVIAKLNQDSKYHALIKDKKVKKIIIIKDRIINIVTES